MPPLEVVPAVGRRNFGDELGPIVLDRLEIGYHHRELFGANLVTCGSLLDLVARLQPPRIQVWGTGFMTSHVTIPRWNVGIKFLAVRGRYSRTQAGLPDDIPVGDPGLLITRPVNARQISGRLGVVPHYIDQDRDTLEGILDSLREWNLHLINVWDPPTKVIEQIGSCEAVVSSSLHGCVIADALKVPNAWMPFSNKVGGDGFKFWDHYSVFFDDPPEFLRCDSAVEVYRAFDEYERPGLQAVQENLIEAAEGIDN